ncbi:MAG: hypothetical protein ACOCSD_05720 [Halolamina sp.]
MVLDESLDWRRHGRMVAVVLLGLFGVALLTSALPVHVSPFLLGATVAVGYWLVRRARAAD